MRLNSSSLVSMTDANQNFSKVARIVDENGAAVILKNNQPKYVLLNYNELSAEGDSIADDEMLEDVAKKVISKHIKAFEELAK